MTTTHFWIVVDCPRKNKYNASTTTAMVAVLILWMASISRRRRLSQVYSYPLNL